MMVPTTTVVFSDGLPVLRFTPPEQVPPSEAPELQVQVDGGPDPAVVGQ